MTDFEGDIEKENLIRKMEMLSDIQNQLDKNRRIRIAGWISAAIGFFLTVSNKQLFTAPFDLFPLTTGLILAGGILGLVAMMRVFKIEDKLDRWTIANTPHSSRIQGE